MWGGEGSRAQDCTASELFNPSPETTYGTQSSSSVFGETEAQTGQGSHTTNLWEPGV